MPRQTLMTLDFTTVERENRARLPLRTAFTNAAATPLEIDLTLDDSTLRAGRSFERSSGLMIHAVLAGGGLTPLPLSSLGEDATLAQSLESEADSLSFSMLGRELSPWRTAALRGRHQVEAVLHYGAPGEEAAVKIFEGYLASSEFDGDTASVVCMDEAITVSQQLAAINLPPNHGLSTMQILRQLAQTYGVTLGDLDLGPVADVPRMKGYQKAETPLIELLRDVISPTAAESWFEGRRFHAQRYTGSEAIVRELTSEDWSTLKVTPPDVASKNSVTAVTVKFEQVAAATGTRTTTQEEVIFGFYAPAGAVQQVDYTGAVTAVALTQPLARREISRTTTRTTYRGATAVRTEVRQFGWRARGTASRQLASDGSVINFVSAGQPVRWFYADGKCYADQHETYQLISVAVQEKVLDAAGNVTADIGREYGWSWGARTPLWIVDGAGVESFNLASGIFVTQEGFAYTAESESFSESRPSSVTTAEHAFDSDGFITLQTTTTQLEHTIGPTISSGVPNSFGWDVDHKTYTQRSTDAPGTSSIVTQRLRQVSEQTYELTTDTDLLDGRPTRKYSPNEQGARPHVEQLQDETKAQELRVTSTDQVRIFLNGIQVETIHTDFAESDAELELIARAAVRKYGAWIVSIEMPLEGIIRPGRWIKLSCDDPVLNLTNARCFVTDVSRSFGSFIQSITTRYLPPELA